MNYLKENEKKMIKDKGHTYTALARRLVITYFCFKQKLENKSVFTCVEVYLLCDVLDINTLEDIKNIFFNGNVEAKHKWKIA